MGVFSSLFSFMLCHFIELNFVTFAWLLWSFKSDIYSYVTLLIMCNKQLF